MEILLSPPVAFLIYIPLVIVIVLLGRQLAGPEKANPIKTSVYHNGEAAPTHAAAPGYRPFFLIAFFFAILHLGILVVGSGLLSPLTAIYVSGLALALLALILG